jgi:ferrous iron transport protein B
MVPVLTGFGCNVIAVFQSRACSACNRKNCVSMIAFASACSYQIGASPSIFNTGTRPWLFVPYLVILFIVGAIHTRIWRNTASERDRTLLTERAFLQTPTFRAIWWRVRATLRQFLFQAMPIFLVICLVGALLAHLGVTDVISTAVGPLLGWLDLA